MSIVPYLAYVQTATNPPPEPSYYSIVLLAFVALFVVRRIIRGLNGRRFSYSRIIFRPVLLIALSVIFLFFPVFYFEDVYVLAGFVALGIVIASRLGSLSSIFTKNGILMYKSSPIFVAIWAFSYICRLAIDFILGINSFLLDSIFLALLALSAGMYLGEGVNLSIKYSAYTERSTSSTDVAQDLFALGNSMGNEQK